MASLSSDTLGIVPFFSFFLRDDNWLANAVERRRRLLLTEPLCGDDMCRYAAANLCYTLPLHDRRNTCSHESPPTH
ncbi:hypothetical protein JOB18_041865 [Solea senegalensis]|uniref:Uncharacterized protein n=1 Tax=Solea senegalensis TaxID=28829 RepID=A0AAV6RI31_SOLSE|nr:hypothetical protein JOB18_041865 [Solea senegalensis]